MKPGYLYIHLFIRLQPMFILYNSTESYLEYFTTPYFIFVRDTLSYFTLLGLHFTLCLQPSTIQFSGLEWAILVFFMGRFLMESKQFLQEGRETVKNVGENEREGEQRRDQISRSTTCATKCGKYLRYCRLCF